MSKFRQQYKAKTFGFGDAAAARIVRTENHEKARKNSRSKIFTGNRNILNSKSNTIQNNEPKVSSASGNHTSRLMEWKVEREKSKKMEQMHKKRPFIVGAVHHKLYSPLSTNNVVGKKLNVPPIPKKVSKVTERRLMLKSQSQKVSKSVVKDSKSSIECSREKQSFAPIDQKVKPLEEPLHQEPLFGRSQCRMSINNFCNKNTENINTETSNKNLPKSNYSELPSEPVFFSPYVVSSRGKSNARTEQQIKRGFSLSRSLSDEIPTKDTVMKNLNISIEEEERTAQYFQFLLNGEVDRLNELCNKWTLVKEESGITEDGQYQINQAIGQTQLLINKKFERFRGLVSDCETGKGEMLVTCKDLQGFWDMMYMEVKNCDSRFDKLEQLRSEGWKEEENVPVITKVTKKKTATKKKIMPKKSSSIRTFLAERKKNIAKEISNNNGTEELKIFDNKYKTRRFSSSNVKKYTPVKYDRTKLNLLQKVQLSETKKHKSPLTMMKISQMCKTPEVQLDDTISYINSDQTPGKSILKQPKKSNEIGSCIKTSHKVNFNDTVVLNEVPMDEETQTKMELAAALARIDSLEFNNSVEEELIHAERKLTFDDNSFEEYEDVFDKNEPSGLKISTKNTMSVPSTHVETATSIKKPTPYHSSATLSPRRSLRRQSVVNETIASITPNIVPSENAVHNTDLNVITRNSQEHILASDEEEVDKHNESIRVLRNRSITSVSTPILRGKSGKVSTNIQQSEHKENINSKIDLYNDINTMRSNEKSDRRKSRRNVKFSDLVTEGKCNSEIEKSVLPMTPHIKKSKSLGVLNEKKKSIGTQDTTSFEIIAPARIRRSQNRTK
nr:uncharacterized protein LOC116428519 isoform X1 [Nomia melanderi]